MVFLLGLYTICACDTWDVKHVFKIGCTFKGYTTLLYVFKSTSAKAVTSEDCFNANKKYVVQATQVDCQFGTVVLT